MRIGRLILLFFMVIIITACAQKPISEIHPDVQFMDVEAVRSYVTDRKVDTPDVIINYEKGGVANIFVKRNNNNIRGSWKVVDDGYGHGLLIIKTPGRTDKGYYSLEGDYYTISGVKK